MHCVLSLTPGFVFSSPWPYTAPHFLFALKKKVFYLVTFVCILMTFLFTKKKV